jgi:Na+:H+ antiporter, NhaA family
MHGDQDINERNGEALPQLPEELIDRVTVPLRRFLRTEAAGGLVLLVAAVVAIGVANSPYRHAFESFWSLRVGLHVEAQIWDRTIRHWINDGLLTLFFFVVGLEVKREIVVGELRRPRKATLALLAAAGGMVVPAALYLMLSPNPDATRGWGAVMSTDTAFVVGSLALLGRRIPDSLRALVLTIAIIDDVGAILVITLGYGHGFESLSFSVAVLGFAITALMRWGGVRSLTAYWLVGIGTWAALHESGIHPTICGVAFALLTPTTPWVDADRLTRFLSWARATEPPASTLHDEAVAEAPMRMLTRAVQESVSPLERLQKRLHPWSSFIVLPLFALANSGVSFGGAAAFKHIALLLIVGLTVGKPVGILVFSWVGVIARLAEKPRGVTWPMLLATGILAGMGFTMTLYISQLAFSGVALQSAKLGTLIASLIAGAAGTTLLYFVTRRTLRPLRAEA